MVSIAYGLMLLVVGGQLFPLQKNKIHLVREDVQFKRTLDTTYGDVFVVTADYVFQNDGPAGEVKIGCERPASGDQPLEGLDVIVNGEHRSEIKQVQGQRIQFKAKFVKGRNTIRHTYIQPRSTSGFSEKEITFQLLTEQQWAGGTIDTFNFSVLTGGQALLIVPQKISAAKTPAVWDAGHSGNIVDTMCLQEMQMEAVTEPVAPCPSKEFVVIAVPEGILRYTEIHFKPSRDLFIVQPGHWWLRERAMRKNGPPPR